MKTIEIGGIIARHRSAGLVACLCLFVSATLAAGDVPPAELIQPFQLAKIVQSSGARPLILQVGFRILFEQAHIPGSEYIGPASREDGLNRLRQRVQSLPKNTAIVLYCGCCPWSHCPNVKPAYDQLTGMGFTNVKLLYIAENFGKDWVAGGYPVAKGEK